jgi:hypothetical protein
VYYAGSFEHGNELPDSIIWEEIFETLIEYLLSPEDPVPSRYIDNQPAASASQTVSKLII